MAEQLPGWLEEPAQVGGDDTTLAILARTDLGGRRACDGVTVGRAGLDQLDRSTVVATPGREVGYLAVDVARPRHAGRDFVPQSRRLLDHHHHALTHQVSSFWRSLLPVMLASM